MEHFTTDYWSYVVGLGLALGIYFVMYIVVPFVFRKVLGSKPAKSIAHNKPVARPVKIVKSKPVFSFEFIEVSGENAIAAFEAAKSEGKGVPIIIGGGEAERQSLADMMQYRNETEHYLRAADAKPNPYSMKSKPRMPKTWVKVGPFPMEANPFLVKNHPEGFKPLVTLAYIPAETSAEIPAYLKLGSWNAVPDADVFVSLLRKWHREYGAELVALRVDSMDVRVSRKPATKEQAMILAREHIKFCPTEAKTPEIAAELMLTDWWHFYWD
jgi:Domain of unknown function (DUF4253)